ncbi:unnamed protein product [Brassicogethes aeneus]|uniref:ER membrane protein complex subunit 1 n=1 Tax=Brassicogethes aeneus TaxID=1431903 RepID=A0A9P0API4_BRAAE|nr:unnamed protein product [Brassicogethes aeneus]
MANIRSICIITINLTLLSCLSHALYEDQVGKFDWKKSYVGKVKFAEFDARKLVVGTEENVVAALSSKTGNVLWRQVMEDPSEQNIELLKIEKDIITVSGNENLWTVRSWDVGTGNLITEWIISVDKVVLYKFDVKDNNLYVVAHDGSMLNVRVFDVQTGLVKSSLQIPFVATNNQCILVQTYYACLVHNVVNYVQLKDNSKVSTIPLQSSENAKISTYKSVTPAIIITTSSVNSEIVFFNGDNHQKHITPVMPNAIGVIDSGTPLIFQLEGTKNPSNLLIKSTIVTNGEELTREFEYPHGLGKPELAAAQCIDHVCNLLLSSADNALLLVRFPEAKVMWTREEALSKIVATEFLELPVSELDASIENEFKGGNVISMFLHRITTQCRQLSNLVFGSQFLANTGLVRDDFGLHKIIVVATKSGKLFGIDTLTGSLAWTYRLPNVKPFKMLDSEKMLLFVQRTARYAPLPAQCTLLAEDSITGNGIIIQFDPITGYSEKSIIRLNYKIRQALLLPNDDENHVKPLVVYSDKGDAFIYPESANTAIATHASHTYLYTVDVNKNTLNGHNLYREGENIKTTLSWTVNLGPSKLVALSAKSPIERVHSQGRVLPDRSVYYKYVNPNLLAVATIADDPIHKNVLSIYLIDGVTGFVAYSTSHKRAKGPIHLVHSENWLVYSFFSERFRRTEVVAAELYEGSTQSNSTVFSSLAISQLPHVETSSYILPAFPLTLAVSLTERGITNKFLFFALNNGVVEIPWLLLQPRFANVACGPEESCIPYMPEVPLPNEAYINYNQTLERIQGIAVAPARLESTSHVLVYGLDLFYTRVAPSKTFDLLKEDFDHILIILVLVGLVIVSFITKYFASQKMLKQAWK